MLIAQGLQLFLLGFELRLRLLGFALVLLIECSEQRFAVVPGVFGATADAAWLARYQRGAQGLDIGAAGEALAIQQRLHDFQRFFSVVALGSGALAGFGQLVQLFLLTAPVALQPVLLRGQLLLAGPEAVQAVERTFGFTERFELGRQLRQLVAKAGLPTDLLLQLIQSLSGFGLRRFGSSRGSF